MSGDKLLKIPLGHNSVTQYSLQDLLAKSRQGVIIYDTVEGRPMLVTDDGLWGRYDAYEPPAYGLIILDELFNDGRFFARQRIFGLTRGEFESDVPERLDDLYDAL